MKIDISKVHRDGGKGEMVRHKNDEGTLKDGRTAPIFIHSIIDDMTGLTPNTMRVYMHLARRADKSGAAWPSYQSVGDHCFSSVSDNPATRKSFARKAIDQLIEAQLLVKENRARDDGGQTSNVYVLVNPPCLLSTPVPIDTPVLIKHPPVPIKHPPVPIDTPRAYKAPEDTPLEDTPLEDTPSEEKGNVGAAPTPLLAVEWLAYVEALCWVCYGHQRTASLTEAQMGALTAEAKKIRDDGYSKEDLRAWWQNIWRKDWRWDKGHQRPRPDEVRSSIPVLRSEVDDRPRYSVDDNYPTNETGRKYSQ